MTTHFEYGVICYGDVHPDCEPCNNGEPIQLTKEQYWAQIRKPDMYWKCPQCRGNAMWDDDSGAFN